MLYFNYASLVIGHNLEETDINRNWLAELIINFD